MVSTPLFIAVVDDDAYVRVAFERLLCAAGFVTRTFSTGEALLASVEGHRPDCVVLDLHMPGMSGFEVQTRLAHAGIPVVIVTGHDTVDAQSRASRNGAKSYLCKPVDQEVLLDAIEAALVH